MIKRHFELVREDIAKSEWLIEHINVKSEYDEDNNIGIIGGSLRFRDGSVFHFREVFVGEVRRYRFHYMDRENNMIFRWDNAPHHRNLSTFPHHVHLPDGVRESGEVMFSEVLHRIEDIVIGSLDED